MSADIWYYAEGATTVGPLSLSEIIAALAKKTDPQQTYVWSESMTDWSLARDVPELRRLFVKPPPLAKPSPTLQAALEPEKKRHGWSFKAGLVGAVSLIATILAAAIGGVIGRAGVQAVMKPSQATVQSQLEDAHQKALPKLRADLPKKIDDVTTMIAVDAKGGTMMYSYRLDADLADYKGINFGAEMKKTITATACKETHYAKSLDYGARYQYSYSDRKGQFIGSVTVDKASCSR